MNTAVYSFLDWISCFFGWIFKNINFYWHLLWLQYFLHFTVYFFYIIRKRDYNLMPISWSCWDMEKHLIGTESQFPVLTLHKTIVHFRKNSCHVKIINFWLVLRINLLQLWVLAYNKLLWYKYQIISFLGFFYFGFISD